MMSDSNEPITSGSNAVSTLSLAIRDKAVLYATYMPFLKGGGLFIPTNKHFTLGDEVHLIISLMEETEKFNLVTKVVWITPAAAQGNRAAGVGVQFKGEDGVKFRNKIETYLAGALKSERPTHTM